MKALIRHVVLGAVMMAVGAGALMAQAGKAEPVYGVSFLVGPAGQEQTYTGTSTFAVDAKGAVTGMMSITSPTTVRAKLSGTLAKGVWTFEYAYDMPDQGCTGVLSGTAEVPADRKVISGKAMVGGDCSPEPMNGSFTFRLQEKK